jgi:hypothetical protein
MYMRGSLTKIAEGFEALKKLRTVVVETTDAVEQRVGSLRKEHEELVSNSPPSACVLGLDSLHFQVRLVTMELGSLREMICAVENHLYYECIYLHKEVQEYASSEISDVAARERILVEREYPAYKHLDQSVHYDFDVTVGLHSQLIASIQAMADYASERASVIESEKGKSAQGLNIDSLIHSNAYVHALVLAKVDLFCNSLTAFNGHHGKYMRRIRDKARLVLKAISKDVRLGDGGGDGSGGGSEDGKAKAAANASVTDDSSLSDTESEPDNIVQRVTEVSPPEEDSSGNSSSRRTDAQRARKKKKREKQKEKKRAQKDSKSTEPSTAPTSTPSSTPSSTPTSEIDGTSEHNQQH